MILAELEPWQLVAKYVIIATVMPTVFAVMVAGIERFITDPIRDWWWRRKYRC